MRKLLILISSLMLGVNSSTIVAGCNNNSNIQTPKHEMTKENLDTFFANNNNFSYKGPSFFKDGVQKDKLNPINQLVRTVLKNIISDNIKEKFKNYFFIKENIIFNVIPDNSDHSKNLGLIKSINLNKESQYKFQIAIYKNYQIEPDILYCSNWLNISFTETKQYNPQEWLKAYRDFLILESGSVFSNILTLPDNSKIVGVEIDHNQEWQKNSELIRKFENNNNSEVLKNIQQNINKFIDPLGSYWQIYKENIFKISTVNFYNYVSIYYQPDDQTVITSIIEDVNITISYDSAYSPYSYSQTFNLNINCF